MVIINKDGEPVAEILNTWYDTPLKSGERVEYSDCCAVEGIDANRDVTLVNYRVGKISKAKKWERYCWDTFASEIRNDGPYATRMFKIS
jgi:hypothetical protein